VVIHALGFGKTIEQDAAEFDTAILHYYWGPVISALSESFRLELDEIRVFRHVHTDDGSFTMSSGLEIPAGTIGAIHYASIVSSMAAFGSPRRTTRQAAPRSIPTAGRCSPSTTTAKPADTASILERGEPDMQLDLAFGGPDPLVDVLASTGMAAINAIAAVCAAPAGVVRFFEDLPHLHGFKLSDRSGRRA
jgi:hypothetical protein